jgi:hypothetical protein
MRMRSAEGRFTEAANMVVYLAGYPAIMGLQPLTSEILSSSGGVAIPGEAKKAKNADARAAGTPKENKGYRKREHCLLRRALGKRDR